MASIVGEPKQQLQRLWTGAVVNLQRPFCLAEAQPVDFARLLSCLQPPNTRATAGKDRKARNGGAKVAEGQVPEPKRPRPAELVLRWTGKRADFPAVGVVQGSPGVSQSRPEPAR